MKGALNDVAACRAFREDVRQRAASYGRDPNKIKIMPGMMPVVAATDQEALDLRFKMRDLIPDDLAVGWLMQNSGGLDFREYDLNGPFPDLPPTNAGTSIQENVVAYARRENKSILETARHVAEGGLAWAGSPTTVADKMQEWVEAEACDGFLVSPPYFPGGVESFVRFVIPELQRRGIFRKEYSGRHLREHLGATVYN